MGFEGIQKNIQSESVDIDTQIDTLLERLPVDVQEGLLEKMSDYALEDQLSLIEEVLEKRSQLRTATPDSGMLLPEGIEVHEIFPDEVREMIEFLFESPDRLDVGVGHAAEVVSAPSQDDVCYKIMREQELIPLGTNDIAKETEIQNHVWQTMDTVHGVRVPAVYSFISEQGTRAMTMERLPAHSLRSIIETGEGELPQSFSTEVFINALEKFVDTLHTNNIHHRDLHAGNVLVHEETGLPCVIDFGLTTMTAVDEESVYRQEVYESGQIKEIVLQSDKQNLLQLKQQIRDFLRTKEDLYV